jgi:hypothetical protein
MSAPHHSNVTGGGGQQPSDTPSWLLLLLQPLQLLLLLHLLQVLLLLHLLLLLWHGRLLQHQMRRLQRLLSG